MDRRTASTALLCIAVLMAGCSGGSNTAAPPTLAVTYTAAQVTECQSAEDILTTPAWSGQEIAAAVGGGNVATDRATILGWINDFLKAEPSIATPTAASAQWLALVAAMKTAQPLFAAPITEAQYKAALDKLWTSISAFDTPCANVIQWGAANLPQ